MNASPQEAPAMAETAHRPEIDGMRAIAILAVIANHVNAGSLPGGFLGVDVFYVISGFVVTGAMRRAPATRWPDQLLRFYARRVKRLMPALLVLVVVGAVAGRLFISPGVDEVGVSLHTGAAALVGMSSVYLFRRSADYFAPSSELNLFTHTWSLGVEEQFYFLFPAILLAVGFSSRATPAGGRRAALTMTLLSVASLVSFVALSRSQPSAAFFLMPARFWELGAGVLTFLLTERRAGYSRGKPLLSLLSVLAIALTMVLTHQQTPLSNVVVTTATAVLLATVDAESMTKRALSSRVATYVGRISYSLYLWHWTVLVVARWTVGVSLSTAPLILVATLAAAEASYRWIERPLRHSRWGGTDGRALFRGFVAIAAAAGAILVLDRRPSARMFLGKTSGQSLPAGMRRYVDADDPSQRRGEECNVLLDAQAANLDPARCGVAASGLAQTTYLLGDSHVEQFYLAARARAIAQGSNLVLAWANSCPLPGPVSRGARCVEAQSQVERRLFERIRAGDQVILGNALYGAFSGFWHPDREPDPTAPRALEDYLVMLESLTTRLRERGVDVTVLLDSAQFYEMHGRSPELCKREWFRPSPAKECVISAPEFLKQRRPIEDGLRSLVAQRGAFRIWDAVDSTTCGDNDCVASYYSDSNHFRSYYAHYLFDKAFP